jgi:hypothetical protein
MTTTEERTMKATTLTGVKIVSLKRLKSSVNGNPRFLVLLNDGTDNETVASGFAADETAAKAAVQKWADANGERKS